MALTKVQPGVIPDQEMTYRILASSLNSSENTVAVLTLSNLVIGRSYELFVHPVIIGSNNVGRIIARHGVIADNILLTATGGTPTEATNDRTSNVSNIKFRAIATTVTFDWAEFSSSVLEGDGSKGGTWVAIMELPYNVVESNKFI